MKGPLDTSLAYKYFMSYRLMDGQRYDEAVVPYKPSRSLRKYLRGLIKRKKQMQITLSVLLSLTAVLLCLPQFNLFAGCLLFFILSAALILPCLPILKDWSSPTHLSISPKGIKLYSRHWYGDKVSKPIPWHQISRLSMQKEKTWHGDETWLLILDSSGQANCIEKLSLDGIGVGEHRKRFLAALKQHLSINQVDQHLQDALNPVKLTSHTEMWLDVLSASPKRLVDSQLSEGHYVCNGRYRVLEQLGIGGQAIAYAAEQIDSSGKALGQVVLKEFVLPAEASLRVSKRAFEPIEREAELLKQVSHPRIVAMLDLFVDDQRAYMVLERVPGQNLRRHVFEKGPIGQKDLLELALQMCDVLSHLHNLNPAVIHRDFTPDNLILNPLEGIKLIDFNVAQQYEASATRTVVGKHSYIPPEQFRGRACPQSDLYALGATLYFLLTAEDPEPITEAHPNKLLPMISAELDKIVAKCTAQDLDKRYKTAHEIAADLKALKSSS
ncbi:MAG: serine/threonine protein kinase [Candidatus Obscuribacterales bacterium]|nr:serine/threonine protein kinase [Candidatus Obscuribacterales bacterium]